MLLPILCLLAVFVARASFVFAYGPLINAHALVGCMFVCDATIDSFVNCFANLIILLLLAWWFVSFTIYYVCYFVSNISVAFKAVVQYFSMS